jgi:circadian clock protein KaiB
VNALTTSAGSDGSGIIEEDKQETYELRLYIAGSTPRSQQAVAVLRRLCDTELAGLCHLRVVDIFQQPQAAKDDQIIAVPTLIKKKPEPVRLFIGDMSNTSEIIKGIKD